MNNRKIKIVFIILLLLAIILIGKSNIYAANLNSNQLFRIHGITINKNTTIEQINTIFGNPKITGDSPFGGKAYTYYNLNQLWVLHIETNQNGKIRAFGGASKDFVAEDVKYGDQNTTSSRFLKGTKLHYIDFSEDTDDILGFYGYNDITDEEIATFWNNYMSDQNKYLRQMQAPAIIISKIARKIGPNSEKEFEQEEATEDILDIAEQLNNAKQRITDYAINTGKTSYLSFTSSGNISFYECYPNPLTLAQTTIGYYKDKSPYEFFLFNLRVDEYSSKYKTAEAIVEGIYVDSTFIQNKKVVELTDKENELIENVKTAYKEFVNYSENMKNDNLWEQEPNYETLPLAAGKINFKAVESATLYLNMIRAGQDLQPLKADERLTDGAQHKAVLVLYLNNSQAGTYKHFFEKPDCVDEDYYNTAMIGVGENLYMGSYISSINYALNDRAGDPQTCGHRYNLLEPDYTIWGVGQAGPGFVYQTQTCQKFIGGTATKNDLVAWPAAGVTPTNAFAGGIGNWTAAFYRFRYDVIDVEDITVKNLSSDKTYNFKNDIEDNYLVTWNADEVTYEAGDVFEITLHNVKDTNTGNYIDYTYRSVFFDPTTSALDTQDIYITTNIDSKTMEKNEEFKIEASIANADKLNNKLLKYISSDDSIVAVRQNGTITAKRGGTATITICSEQDSTIQKNIIITVNKAPGEFDDDPNPFPDDPEPTTYMLGDINQDGIINADDAAEAIELFKTQSATDEDKLIGDMNEDGKIDAEDAALIIEYFKTHK